MRSCCIAVHSWRTPAVLSDKLALCVSSASGHEVSGFHITGVQQSLQEPEISFQSLSFSQCQLEIIVPCIEPMYSAGYKTEETENLGMKIFPEHPCRRQSFGAKVAGRTLWTGLKPAKTMHKYHSHQLHFKRSGSRSLGKLCYLVTIYWDQVLVQLAL